MIEPRWLDKHGLVRPHHWMDSTGNGLLYSAIYVFLNGGYPFDFEPLWNNELRVLMRTPDNKFGQESHDNWLSLAALYLGLKNQQRSARFHVLNAIFHGGFMQNDFKEKGAFWKSQLLRFPQIWLIFIAAAYPNVVVRFLVRNILRFMLVFSRVNVRDASGCQLRWLVLYSIKLMGNPIPMKRFLLRLRESGTSMSKIMESEGYYEVGEFGRHPILEGFDKFEKGIIQ